MTLEEMIRAIRCPRCGHEQTLQAQDVVETVTVGTTVIQVPVRAGVCSFCGEHVFDPVATDKIDAIIREVRSGNISHLVPIGQVYRAS
jgi:YgiT-type zinc finger domain-containing protein